MKHISWDHPKSQVTLWCRSFFPRVFTDGGRSYGDVITKFSRLDGLPIFLTNGALLSPSAPWSSAIKEPLSRKSTKKRKEPLRGTGGIRVFPIKSGMTFTSAIDNRKKKNKQQPTVVITDQRAQRKRYKPHATRDKVKMVSVSLQNKKC